MKKHITTILMMMLVGVRTASALSTNDIVGRWTVAIATTNHVPVFGDVAWQSITFASNQVSWAWIRDGRAENHRGTFAVIPEVAAKPGMRHVFRIEIFPTTLAAPGPLVLKNVTCGLDNRFRYGTLVLKFQDEEGHRHVFLPDHAADGITFSEVFRDMVHIDRAEDPTGFGRITEKEFLTLAGRKSESVKGKTIYRCSVYYSGMKVHRIHVHDNVLIVEINKYARPHSHPPQPPEGKKYRYNIYVATDSPISYKKVELKYVAVPPDAPNAPVRK